MSSMSKRQSQVALSLGAQVAQITVGYSDQICTVVVNLNCILRICLSYAKDELIRQLVVFMKQEQEHLRELRDEIELSGAKAVLDKLIIIKDTLETAVLENLFLFDNQGAQIAYSQGLDRVASEILSHRVTYSFGKDLSLLIQPSPLSQQPKKK